MIGADEIWVIALGMILGIVALAYLVILTIIRISINKRRAGSDKPPNS